MFIFQSEREGSCLGHDDINYIYPPSPHTRLWQCSVESSFVCTVRTDKSSGKYSTLYQPSSRAAVGTYSTVVVREIENKLETMTWWFWHHFNNIWTREAGKPTRKEFTDCLHAALSALMDDSRWLCGLLWSSEGAWFCLWTCRTWEDRDQCKYYEGDGTTYIWLSLDVQSKVMNLLGRISPTEVDKWQWNLAHDLIDELTEILLWTDRHKFICPCSRKMPREVRLTEICDVGDVRILRMEFQQLLMRNLYFVSVYLFNIIPLSVSVALYPVDDLTEEWADWLTDWLTCWWVPDYICCGGT